MNFQLSKVEIENVLLTPNYKYGNITVTIGESRDVLNITADVLQDILKLLVHTSFSVPKDERDREYQRNILKVTINFCRVVNGVGGDFISKFVGNELRRITKIPLKCPLVKKTYTFNDFQMNDELFPSYLIKDLKFVANFKAMVKVAKEKNLVPFFIARMTGAIGKS